MAHARAAEARGSARPQASQYGRGVFIARVVGDVVATHRHGELAGRKLLLVRRLTLEGGETGSEVIALDVIGVGVGERVLVVQEGGAARALSKSAHVPAQAVVVGVVDRVDLRDDTDAADMKDDADEQNDVDVKDVKDVKDGAGPKEDR